MTSVQTEQTKQANATRLRGVLLDVDGTLIDSNDAHANAWVDTFREFGIAAGTFERVRPMIGMGGDKLLPAVTGLDHESEVAKRMTAWRMERFTNEYLPTLHAFAGAHELLARFADDGLRLVVATSANRDELDDLLEQAGLAELIDRKTSSSDADHSKPDPDIITAALRRGELRADDVLMLGDTPYDIEAAARAGVRTVALRCGGWDDERLADAIEIHDDAAALARDYDQSVFRRV